MITNQKVGQSELAYHPLNIMPDKMLLCASSVWSTDWGLQSTNLHHSCMSHGCINWL